MKCISLLIMTLFAVKLSTADDEMAKLRKEIYEMNSELKTLANHHAFEMNKMKKEMEALRQEASQQPNPGNRKKNEQLTLEWAKNALDEVRREVNEIGAAVNSSEWLKQQQHLKNQLEMVLAESAGLAKELEIANSRLDGQDAALTQVNNELGQVKSCVVKSKLATKDLKKELQTSKLEWSIGLKKLNKRPKTAINETAVKEEAAHKYRHDRLIRKKISEMGREQRKMANKQQVMQIEFLEMKQQMINHKPPDLNRLLEKIEDVNQETEHQKEKLANISVQMLDFDRLHASLLQLLESVENVESKVDKELPEVRKEISQLEAALAQTTSSIAYLRESEDNVRQSMQAIAVSVSNVMKNEEKMKSDIDTLNTSIKTLQQASKQHFFKLNDHILKTEANPVELNSTSDLPELIEAVEELSAPHAQYELLVRHLPHDCSAIDGEPGLYLISPSTSLAPIHVFCNNGSTLLQRRFNGSIDFDRKFSDYAAGFGDPLSELWIGNEYLHALTSNNCSGLYVSMTDIYNGAWYAKYDKFLVGDAESGYKLETYNFKGNASDAFVYQQGMEFSAKDRDRDISNTHCAINYEGGWWYSHCQHVNLNGKYTLGLTWFDSVHNEWIAISTSSMWLFKRDGCDK